MPWAQFDDHFHDSEPALVAGPEACGLHLLATTWSAAHLTDGHIPEVIARTFIERCEHGDDLVARLVGAGLWEEDADGWQLPRFLDDNRSREVVDKDKVAKKRKAKEMADKRWQGKGKRAKG